MEILYKLRIIESKDWATFLFLFALILIVIVKTIFTQRFYIFLELVLSDKYLKLYNKSENLTSTFNILLYVVQLISLSFLTLLLLEHFNLCNRSNGTVFIQIITVFFVFSTAKYIIEKIISVIFDIENLVTVFNHFKMSYRSYVTMFLLPFVAILYYNDISNYVVFTLIFLILTYNFIIYVNIIKYYKEKILTCFFYFILYFCTLEIAPFYFLFYWIKNN